MAALASSDVTVTCDLKNSQHLGKKGRSHRVSLALFNAALTYPSGGVDLGSIKGKLGCPNEIVSLSVIEDNAAGYMYQWDISASKLRIFEMVESGTPADRAFVELDTSDAPAALALECEVKGW